MSPRSGALRPASTGAMSPAAQAVAPYKSRSIFCVPGSTNRTQPSRSRNIAMPAHTQPVSTSQPGLDTAPGAYAVTGFDAAGLAAGIKKNGAQDQALVASRVPCSAAGVFTQNAFPAAPVNYDRSLLDFNPEAVYAIVVN